MHRPPPEALRTAAEWLSCAEDDIEADCAAVAKWLDDQAAAAEIRAAARQHGIPTALLRRRLAGMNGAP